MNDKLKKCIKKKYKLFNLLKRGLISRNSFKMYKKSLTWVTKKMREHYFKLKFFNCFGDNFTTWKNINLILNRKNKSDEIMNICENGVNIDQANIPNHFNNYFLTTVASLTQNLSSDLNYEFLSRIPRNVGSCFFFPSNKYEITSIIKSLPNKGNSLCEIKPYILSKICEFVAPVLSYVYNLCVSSGKYPTQMKVARVVPIHKSGSKALPSNFRPISNLSVFNKIFEKLTYQRIENFLNLYNVLTPLQFGFRKGKNTTLAIFSFLSHVLNSFNKRTFCIALFLDLRKAFDTVDHNVLLYKLSLYGFRGQALEFIRSYLTDRQQYVEVNGKKSDMGRISVGVPQGSVLGPILFNIFINDIANICPGNKVLFADDAVLFVEDVSFDGCVNKMRQLLCNLSNWLKNNKLLPNTNKTKLMLFSSRVINVYPNLFFDGDLLEWVTEIDYLGLCIDNRLSFSSHIQYVNKELNKLLGVIYSMSSLVPQSVLVTLYKSLVLSKVMYNIIIWGGTSNIHINAIHVTINKILRIILGVKYDRNRIPMMRTGDMYKKLNLMKLKDIYKFSLLKFYHQIVYFDNNSNIFNDYFSHLLPGHTYETRGVRINLPQVRLQIEKNFPIFQICKLINELPEEFVLYQSSFSLKKRFKNMILMAYQ